MNNRVLKNASWIIACKVLQSILSFVVGLLTARYLAPSNYGLISYASSIVAFFIPLMRLGFSSTLVQEFITKPEENGKVLGTALVFNLFSAVACIVGIVSFSLVANPDEPVTLIVCFLYSLTLLFQICEMMEYYFQAKLLSKFPSIATLIAYTLVALYKIYLLATGKNIYYFALSHVLEMMLVALLLFLFYKKQHAPRLSFSAVLGRKMLSRSYPYILSGLMVVTFQQTDRIMLKLLVGNSAVGFYSAAISCIGMSAFLFSAIFDSARPPILESHLADETIFQKRITQLSAIVLAVSFAQAVCMTLFASPVIPKFFGNDYLPTVRVLQVCVWYVPFAYLGMVRDIWILAKQKQRYLWLTNGLGVVTNIALNYLLIPLFGPIGASLATVVTQVFTNFILTFLIQPLRPCGRLILRSFHPKYLIELIPRKRKGDF